MAERATAVSARELHRSLVEVWCCKGGDDTKIPSVKAKFFNPRGSLDFAGTLAGVNAVDLIFAGHSGGIGTKDPGWTRINSDGWIKMSLKDYQTLMTPPQKD